jgi:hypothetical protein
VGIKHIRQAVIAMLGMERLDGPQRDTLRVALAIPSNALDVPPYRIGRPLSAASSASRHNTDPVNDAAGRDFLTQQCFARSSLPEPGIGYCRYMPTPARLPSR